ncbi:sugar ABC transporter ATPase [Microbacterium sp. NPDC056003]|uniref:sugar ABC transporter ATPase n=1 Tax=Microbacterium sp. NPDC056003 TaxID=3345676 RepID=UPI0035DAA5E3
MSDSNPADDLALAGEDQPAVQPLRDGDTSIETDAQQDPAQAEWDRTTALDEGAAPQDLDVDTATGADPAMIADERGEIPAEDLPGRGVQPETQGQSPVDAELGDEGQGDLAPEDL